MNTRELLLLSPYRSPTQNALYLGDDDVAACLHGLTARWHPAAALGAAVHALWTNDEDAVRRARQARADKLRSARGGACAVTVCPVELSRVGDKQLSLRWPGSLLKGQPANVLASAALLERLGREQPDK